MITSKKWILKKSISICLSIILVLTSFLPVLGILGGISAEAAVVVPGAIEIYTLEDLDNIRNDLTANYILMNDIDASETESWNDGAGFLPIGGFVDVPGDPGCPDCGDPDCSDPYCGDLCPNCGDPYCSDPYCGDLCPNCGDSYCSDPNCGDPYGGGDLCPGCGLPDCSDPYCGDPYGGGPGCPECGDPNCSDPYCGDIYGGDNPWGSGYDVQGEEFKPASTIGGSSFSGSFDGQGFTICGLHINYPQGNSIGLFDSLISDGEIKNLHLENVNITGNTGVGSLVGRINDGTVKDSSSSGVVNGEDNVGGLVGTSYGTITRSSFSGTVDGTHNVGGMVGYNYGTVRRSYVEGSVFGHWAVGGLVGINEFGTLTDTYSTASIQGASGSGGLVGVVNFGEINNSYYAGLLYEQQFGIPGALVGVRYYGYVTNSFWDSDIVDYGSEGGIGKNSAEMKDIRTFTDVAWSSGLDEPWDFVGNPYDDESDEDIWHIDPEVNNGYPFLVLGDFQYEPGDPGDPGEPCDKEAAIQAADDAIVALPEAADLTLDDKAAVEAARALVEAAKDEHGAVDADFADLAKLEAAEAKIDELEADAAKNAAIQAAVNAIESLPSASEITLADKSDVEAARFLVEEAKSQHGATDDDFGTSLAKLEATEAKIADLEAAPLEIYTLDDLNNVRNNLGANYILMNDIDASATATAEWDGGFEPIGTFDEPFIGSFDGQGFTITGLYINRPSQIDVGLFGCIEDAFIKDLHLEDVNITGDTFLGALVGYSVSSTISDSTSEGSVFGLYYVGGLIGDIYDSEVVNSSSSGIVSGECCVGGLIGSNSQGNVLNSSFNGTVTGVSLDSETGTSGINYLSSLEDNYSYSIGGLIGRNDGLVEGGNSTATVTGGFGVGGLVGDNSGTIKESSSNSTVSGNNAVGGLVGEKYGLITTSYSTGSVTGGFSVGGLAGTNNYSSILESYSTANVDGECCVGGLVGYNSEGIVRDSYATGTVTGLYSVGGLIGESWEGLVVNCYSTGKVSGESDVGGLIGARANDCEISNSFWDIETSEQTDSAGGTGKTASDMKNVRTFTDVSWSAGLDEPWDFVGNPYGDIGTDNIWDIDPAVNNGYPFLNSLGGEPSDPGDPGDPCDKEAAIQAANDAIANLPEEADLTLADKSDVEAARALVNAAKADHGAVDGDFADLAKLVAAESRIAQLEAGFTTTPMISAGGTHSLVLKSDGTVWAWGDATRGRLGIGDIIQNKYLTPVQVLGLAEVVAISAGYEHSLALKSDGTVWAWGYNGSDRLGSGVSSHIEKVPVQVSGLTEVVAISAGFAHSLALKSDGTLWAWGENSNGQLGDGTTIDKSTSVQVSGLTEVVEVSAGGGYSRITNHSLALKSDGTLWAWGANCYGQLGIVGATDYLAPVQVSSLAEVAGISAGGWHSLALKSDGTARAWGRGNSGQLGNGTWDYSKFSPVTVSALTNTLAVSAGGRHSLALKSNGTVWSWGENWKGQLGIGTLDYKNIPSEVSGLEDVVAISAGTTHSLAIKSDGTVWSWGDNEWGMLGDGTETQRTSPVQVLINLGDTPYEDAERQAAINRIKDAIAALPLPADLTLHNRAEVDAIRALINAAKSEHGLEDDDIENLDRLNEAENWIEALEDAKQDAIDLAVYAIASLPSVEDLTLDDKEAVEAARALVEEAKSEHSAVDGDFGEALSTLEAAEARIAQLEDEDILLGDVNGDGAVNIADAILLLRYIVGLIDISDLFGPNALARAKISETPGNPNVNDAIAILQHIVGLR